MKITEIFSFGYGGGGCHHEGHREHSGYGHGDHWGYSGSSYSGGYHRGGGYYGGGYHGGRNSILGLRISL